jgi:uncharacterized membrane protein YedE/YeeE
MRKPMVRNLAALIAGLLFGAGLIISGMYQPTKVLGFLDLAGAWDPSLALVMGGAILVAFPAFLFSRRRGRDAGGEAIKLPETHKIDAPLAVGALIFGVGWGLTGVCPGPGLVDLGFLNPGAAIFVVAMIAGIFAHRWLGVRWGGRREVAQDA